MWICNWYNNANSILFAILKCPKVSFIFLWDVKVKNNQIFVFLVCDENHTSWSNHTMCESTCANRFDSLPVEVCQQIAEGCICDSGYYLNQLGECVKEENCSICYTPEPKQVWNYKKIYKLFWPLTRTKKQQIIYLSSSCSCANFNTKSQSAMIHSVHYCTLCHILHTMSVYP